MPNFTHQALNRVNPKAPIEPKGDPLSARIIWGIPYSLKTLSKDGRTVSTLWQGSKQKSKM
jgi:hypothetical protein